MKFCKHTPRDHEVMGWTCDGHGLAVLVFLQNPWSRAYAGRKWDGASWERAMWASRTGIRLRYLFPADAPTTVAVRNCNPIATRAVTGLRRPDPLYVREQVADLAPKVLLLAGVQARFVGEMGFDIPFVTMPHPAWRVLSNDKLDMVRDHVLSALKSVTP